MSARGLRARRILTRAAAIVMLVGVGSLIATDAPHDAIVLIGGNPRLCEKCHIGHNAAGGSLTSISGNANLCLSCHTSGGDADPFILGLGDQATTGVVGTSHRWDADVVSAAHQTTAPTDPQMSLRTPGGKLMCSTCHDQHINESSGGWGKRSTAPVGLVGNTSTGRISTNGAFTGTVPTTYWIQITGGGTFDWWTDGNGPTPEVIGAGVTLGAQGPTVTFTGSFVVGDRWTIEAIIPFLRSQNDLNQMCEDCHQQRVMAHTTWDVNLTTPTPAYGGIRSHPVGIALNANGMAYDFAAPLDVDGFDAATTTDRNSSNDLPLYGGTVRCLTCHGLHRADSDSATTDAPPPPP